MADLKSLMKEMSKLRATKKEITRKLTVLCKERGENNEKIANTVRS